MKKTIKLLILVMILMISITSITKVDAATTAPSTIKMGTGESLPSYIGQTHFSTKITNDGKYAYCTNINLKTPNNLEMKLVEAKDAGVAYIMTNGYPAKTITGNDKYDYYITQTALWWYLDDTAGGNNLGNGFKQTGADPYGLRKYVITLKEQAKKAKDTGYSKPSVSLSTSSTELTISSDGKYFYSSDITVKGESITGNITLSLENAPKTATIIDSKGNEVSSVANGSKVKIKIQASSITSLENEMTIKATATGKTEKAYMYKPTSDKYQPVVVSVLFPETETVNTSKKLTLKTTKLEIIKIDSETQKPLAGAKLQLINAEGKIVDTWTTTTVAHSLSHLAAGTYTLVEVQAPTSYELSTVKQKVVLEKGKLTKVTFENTKKPTIVEIIKKDKETNEILAGATFVIKNSKGEEIETWISTKESHKITGLPEGDYIIEELNAPAGYIKTNEKHSVTLEAGKPITITFYNTKEVIEIDSALKILKVNGETNEPLAGAKLVLKDKSGNEVASWITTTEEYIINNIKPGTYYLSEVEAPEGFVLSTEVIEIIVTEDGGTVMVTFYNTPEVEVPNTATSISKTMIGLGIVATVIGGSVIFITLRKEEN